MLPLFYYCDVVWCPTTARFTSMIERVHAKFVKKLPPSCTCAAGLPFTLTERRHNHTAIQIFQSIKHYSPSYLLDIFQYSKDVTGYCGRNANRPFVPRVSTNFDKRSFFYRGTMLWSSLPSTVVEATTFSSFKYLYFY